MKTLLVVVAAMMVAGQAVAGDMPGTFALEPFVRYGSVGEPTIKWSGEGETQTFKRFATGWTVDAGLRFIVPVSTKLDVRGFASVGKQEDKDHGQGVSPTWQRDETVIKRTGYDLGISVRYWIRLGE